MMNSDDVTIQTEAAQPPLQPFAPFEAPLTGTSLIEASAGTGKTYTITGLYLRLILEGERRVDQILVVTFTNAATEELKDRILRRLLDVRETFSSGSAADDFCQALLDRNPDRERMLRRLENAIRGFDEAAIYTIHSFCQRVLRDQAFASGMPFETELRADVRDILQEIVEDFWRRHFYEASPLLVDYLLDQRYRPERFLQEVRPHLGKPYLTILGGEDPQAFADAEQLFAQAYGKVRELWQHARDAIETLLLEDNALNGNKYRKTSLPNWFGLMNEYLQPQQANLQLFDYFEKFTARTLAESAKKGQVPPQHGFFVVCEELAIAHAQLSGQYQAYLKALRVKLLAYCNRELETRKLRERVQSYDDLLSNLQRALNGPLGENLANHIRKRYTAALIDEFQDTDPVQYEIFRTIYAGSDLPVFIVGDPKQAIYSFRGADIFAYLQANARADQRFTLDRNWRSEPALIEAVNALFDNVGQPFVFPEIGFYPAHPAERERSVLSVEDDEEVKSLEETGGQALFHIWFLSDADPAKALSKGEADAQVARATAIEIARLLNLSAAGKARIGDRALAGGDMAVLVRNHRQGKLVRDQLLALGVPSVQHAQDNVFHSEEAQELEWLLTAVTEPGREGVVRAALATRLFGVSAGELYRISQDYTAWEAILDRFYRYHQLWREYGFIHLYRTLMREQNIAHRLLALNDGERRLTNLQHLAELLQGASRQLRLSPEGLIKWLIEHRLSEYAEDEEHQLRLESDEHLVQIVTIHKSKGLEYAIVFCPFLWDGRLWSQKDETLTFHDPDNDYQATLDLGSALLEDKRAVARREELAENLRLLYVALTRARQRCYMAWGNINDAGLAAPAWLLHRPAVIDPATDMVSALAERVKSMNTPALLSEVMAVAAKAQGAISVSALPQRPALRYQPPQQVTPTFTARVFDAPQPARSAWRISSFTALTVHHGAETPDYDALIRSEPVVSRDSVRDIFHFPRGARAGSCLHKLFEDWDFVSDDRTALQQLVAKTLDEFGFSRDWLEVIIDMVEQVLATPLDDNGLTLGVIGQQQRLNELEFYYPLTRLSPDGLQQVLRHYGRKPGHFGEQIRELSFETVNGFMKGFIDLVFEAGGRFYIVDYKSNWLGNSVTDYRPQRLYEAMARDDYYLQYLIYTVAVHRYLRLRLDGYDYDRHFGGVFYLFLRGMQPGDTDAGVFRDRPEKTLIDALDRYLDSGSTD